MPINCLPSSICHFLRLTGKLLPTHPACLWPEETFIIYMLIAVINSLQRHLPAVSGHFPSFFLLFFLSCQRLKQIIKYIALPSGGERGGSIKRLFYGPFVHLSSQPKALGNCGNALLPCPEAWVIGSGHKGRLLTQQ